MQKKMASEVAAIWAARDPAIDDVIKSPAEMVTLASLVEKETGVETERPQVASVFINRLRKNMRLQTDPSVVYGITLGKGKLDRGLTTKDLKAKTPYNTYQIDGLPPGPIANPGRRCARGRGPSGGHQLSLLRCQGHRPQGRALFLGHLCRAPQERGALSQGVPPRARTRPPRKRSKPSRRQKAGDTTQ